MITPEWNAVMVPSVVLTVIRWPNKKISWKCQQEKSANYFTHV